MKVVDAIAKYQCPGCLYGPNPRMCPKFQQSHLPEHAECSNHTVATTVITGSVMRGSIFLGLPNGFNRLGVYPQMKLHIYESWDHLSKACEDPKFNVIIWKHLDQRGNTVLRGLRPRLNEPYLYLVLGDCRDKLPGIEISLTDAAQMD